MAFILGQDEDDDQQAGSQAPATQGQQTANVGGGTAPASTGVGKGGQGGWTNLQSYISANASDTGGANALKSEVGSEFGKEKSNITNDSSKFVYDAEKQVKDSSIDNKQADDLISSSAQAYNYDAAASKPLAYQQNVDKVRGALTNQYSGPKEYSYGLSGQAQQYGTALKDDQSFNGLMGDIYGKKAGGALSSGQKNLQTQLDVHNTALGDARKQLTGDYTGLEGLRDETVKSTTDKLGGLEQTYRQNQNNLRDYLGLQGNTYDTKSAQLEADARAAHNRTYTTGAANMGTLTSNVQDRLRAGQDAYNNADIAAWAAPQYITEIDNGSAGFNWQDLENSSQGNHINYANLEGALYDSLGRGTTERSKQDIKYSYGSSAPVVQAADADYRTRGQAAMNDFYNTETDKYKNTADTEKRSFNVIQDFLNSESPRKQAGFNVRKK